jgi:hypothetical protein
MRRFPTLAFTLILLGPSVVIAQEAGSLPRVFELPASTRAMALGDAYMMNAGHADAIFYHPALLTGASGFGIEMQRWGDDASSVAMSAATQWVGAGIGIGVTMLQYGAPSGGVGAAPEGQDHLFTQGPVAVSERAVVLGYAREIVGLDIGVNGKIVEERIGSGRDAVGLFDVGAAGDIGPVRLGLTVRDIGEDPLLADPDATPRIVLGAGSYGRQVGIFDLGVSAAATWSDERTTLSGGLEVGYWPVRGRTFVARVGFQDPHDDSDMSPLSVGFAFWGDDITAEWAFRPYGGDESAGTHRFGLRWR